MPSRSSVCFGLTGETLVVAFAGGTAAASGALRGTEVCCGRRAAGVTLVASLGARPEVSEVALALDRQFVRRPGFHREMREQGVRGYRQRSVRRP